MTASPASPRSLPSRLLSIALLMIAGAGAGFGMIYLSDTVDGSGWPDTLALGVGSVPLIIAAMIVLQMATRRGADVLKGCGGLQVLVMGLAGVMMLLPIVGSRFASPGLVMAALAIMLVVQTLANLLLWRRADEMLRRVMTETATLAFWVLQSALFLYAAAERLGLVHGVTAWGMMGILMGVYFVASAIAAARRGIH
jgi:hypothetical protein